MMASRPMTAGHHAYSSLSSMCSPQVHMASSTGLNVCPSSVSEYILVGEELALNDRGKVCILPL